jgi:hypothetical protein
MFLPSDLREQLRVVILIRGTRRRLCAAGSGEMQVAVPNTCPS